MGLLFAALILAFAMASIGVMPTPLLISTSGLLGFGRKTKDPAGGGGLKPNQGADPCP
jgi:hypothetical protein